MASYEYSGTYYDTYYLFVTDSDAGSGAENTTYSVKIAAIETASGLDALTSIRPSPVPQADAGLGAENTSYSVKVITADAGLGAENSSYLLRLGALTTDVGSGTDNGGVTGGTSFASDIDTITGLDSQGQIGISDGDTTNAVEIDYFFGQDYAFFSEDTELVSLADADVFSGGGSSVPVVLADADTVLGFDNAQAFRVGLSSSDAGAGIEATGFLPAFPFSDSDSFRGTEANAALVPDYADADSFSGSEAVVSWTAHLSDSDAFTGSDVGVAIVPVTSSDAAHGGESNGTQNVSDPPDTGAFTEISTYTIALAAADAFSGSDGQSLPGILLDSDVGHFSESGLITHVTLSAADSIHWIELAANAVDTNLLYGMLESFTVYRCAVLAGGVEAAQLYGVREATLTPQADSYPCSSDDIIIGNWINITSATLEVTGGYIPWSVLALLRGANVSSAGSSYAISYGRQYTGPALPVVIRARGKNYLGHARTFDFVLYSVQIGIDAVTRTYKNGAEVTFTGYAMLSSTDEAGNILAVPEIGRTINSPGQLSGAIAAGSLFGVGT